MKSHRRNPRKMAQAGMTLIEIMIVVAIIAMIAALVGPNVFRQLAKSNQGAAKAQIKNFEGALVQYKLEYKKFPSSGEGLNALVNNPKNINFLSGTKTIPKDPWGNDYVYKSPGPNGLPYEIISYGEDGQPGGSDLNADISSANLAGDE